MPGLAARRLFVLSVYDRVYLATGPTDLRKIDPNQLTIFNEAEVEAGPTPEPTMEQITYARKKRTARTLCLCLPSMRARGREEYYRSSAQEVLHKDETTVQVLKEPGRAPESTSYMWLYRIGRDGPPTAPGSRGICM